MPEKGKKLYGSGGYDYERIRPLFAQDRWTKYGRPRGGWRYWSHDKEASKKRRKQAETSRRRNRRG